MVFIALKEEEITVKSTSTRPVAAPPATRTSTRLNPPIPHPGFSTRTDSTFLVYHAARYGQPALDNSRTEGRYATKLLKFMTFIW